MLKTTIPFVDLRGKPQSDLLRAYPDKAALLVAASRRTVGVISLLASIPALPFADWRSRRWLLRRANPYLHEIEEASEIVNKHGIYALNLCYEWGCTSGAYVSGNRLQLLRIMDWPFPDLGKHMVVALQSAAAGEFLNVTWPGLSGMFQGVAPGRFAASINMAPMRKHGLWYVGDWLKNRWLVNRAQGLPPAHLLRQVFEQAKNYAEAKEMLSHTKLATPAIFTLTGVSPGEGCIIERLENAAEIQELSVAQSVSASNEFHSRFAQMGKGWRPRAMDSAGRYRQSQTIGTQELHPQQPQEIFAWLRPPMLNDWTRLVLLANAQDGTLHVQGFQGHAAVTEPFTIDCKN